MTVRVGINGFGRIGRNYLRAAKAAGADIDLVAVNDLTSTDALAGLLEYDSTQGRYQGQIKVVDDGIEVDGDKIKVFAERDPKALPWGDLGVDVVIESTGIFTTRDQASVHLEQGAPHVIVSAPSTGADGTFVMGVNEHEFDAAKHKVTSIGSCTTNCFVPMVQVLDDAFGIDNGLMTTVHSYTQDQNLQDGPHKDMRRARAAALNIVPTSTGAAKATGKVLTAMEGRLDGTSLRVPTPVGSITDFVAVLKQEASAADVNRAFREAAAGKMSKIMEYTEDPIVLQDVVGNPKSCVFDAPLTMVNKNLVKVFGWYDNEWGFSNRLVEFSALAGAAIQK
jgi:glyceraldehyde 3-phosphate dehydrogenase